MVENKSETTNEVQSLDKEIEILEAPMSIERNLTHPETGESKTFSQHEMGFITKLKFFRLLSGTLRLAVDSGSGVTSLITDLFGDVDEGVDNESLALGVMRLVELSPDFIEESYLYALNVKPKDQLWAREAFENLGDDEGLDILEVFIAQNGNSMRDFFVEKLPKIGEKIMNTIERDTEQE